MDFNLNATPSGNRVHIGFFGRRNAGKSSLVNAVTGQQLSVVSDVPGTTTDPVSKAMELLPVGPVVIIDTPGYDDQGELGEKRVGQARRALNRTDVAVLVADATLGLTDTDRTLLKLFEEKGIPYIIALNKCDLAHSEVATAHPVSAKLGEGVRELKEKIALLAQRDAPKARLVGACVEALQTVILVTPIDASAPKGRMILPQQQVLRDLLDASALTMVVRESELAAALARLGGAVDLVITDSQVFDKVSRIVPTHVPLTSFSILFAHYKGFLEAAVRGATALDRLNAGDLVLMCEGCTHHRQCGDIGTVKLPNWLSAHAGKDLAFEFTSGGDFPDDLSRYQVIIHCGGCMLGERELLTRMEAAARQGVPFTNYGVAIAHMNGVLKRSLCLYPALQALL
ncbi:MAG: [FeFe] hydrogenase H-cluster maturation GTPase HydF [Clostridia bacterium]